MAFSHLGLIEPVKRYPVQCIGEFPNLSNCTYNLCWSVGGDNLVKSFPAVAPQQCIGIIASSPSKTSSPPSNLPGRLPASWHRRWRRHQRCHWHSLIGKPTQIGLNFFPFPDYSQLMRKPAWGHIEAGRESKFVFFLRRVDIRFILLLQPLIPNFLFFCLPKLILLGYPIKN